MTYNGYKVRFGGLMRCCLATLDEHMRVGRKPREDERLKCHGCSNWVVYRNDAWEWDGTRAKRKEK